MDNSNAPATLAHFFFIAEGDNRIVIENKDLTSKSRSKKNTNEIDLLIAKVS